MPYPNWNDYLGQWLHLFFTQNMDRLLVFLEKVVEKCKIDSNEI